MPHLRHLKDINISAFLVNEKGQLCLPNHDYPKMVAIFNKIIEENGNIMLGFSEKFISPGKEW
jgi:hypothetical protein